MLGGGRRVKDFVIKRYGNQGEGKEVSVIMVPLCHARKSFT